ncbi:MAG: DUF72 domain-containing protein [Candidatus Methanomethylicia archaeon]|uniref:DUF72 domain-containing protein n=1 Tax=Saccharolobus sp. TaxID=2100761 RepID=UPI00316729B8
MRIKVGTCGFTSKHFNFFEVLEVQQTFYDIVNENTLKRWRKEAPNVEFTIKALQVITHEYNKSTYSRMKNTFGNVENYGHFKPTKEVQIALDETIREARILNAKIIVFQTPPSFKPNEVNINNLINFFSTLSNNFIYAWEPRGEEWYRDLKILENIFSKIKAIHVVDPFRRESLTKGLKYYRLHGLGKGELNYGYKYTDEDLNKLYEIVKRDIEENEEIYVMFNNIHSFNDALRFKSIIEERKLNPSK